MEALNTIKLNIIINQTLDQCGGGIIMSRIILPIGEFRTSVLMNFLIGKFNYSNGGILMSVQKKFWIIMLIYAISTWCFAFAIMWIIYN